MSPTKKNNNKLIVCSISKKSVANAPENLFGSNLEFLLPVCSRLDRIVRKTRETNENSFQMPPSTSQCTSGLVLYKVCKNVHTPCPENSFGQICLKTDNSRPLEINAGPLEIKAGPLEIKAGPLEIKAGPLGSTFNEFLRNSQKCHRISSKTTKNYQMSEQLPKSARIAKKMPKLCNTSQNMLNTPKNSSNIQTCTKTVA